MTTARHDSFRSIAAAGLALYLFTALSNVGIVAIDDYTIMQRVFPAQSHTVASVMATAEINSVLPPLLHLGIATVTSWLGITHPLTQLRVDQAVVGTCGFLLSLWGGWLAFTAYDDTERRRHRTMFAALLGFYFLAPLFLTRPMVESLSAPFLMLGAGIACRYFATGRRRDLVASVFAFGAAAALRPQVGLTVLALLPAIGIRRRSDLWVWAVAGLAVFIISGLPDLFLRGAFHESLRRYVAFNIENTHAFESSPWYLFVLLILGATLPPVFLARYRGLPWRERYGPLLPAVTAFGIFLVSHSLVPHKEERFMIPIVPLLLLLLTPLACWLRAHGPQWRVRLFLVANGILLLLTVSNAPQATGMGLAGYLDQHQAITEVARADDAIVVLQAFITHPVTIVKAIPDSIGCGTGVATLALGPHAATLAHDVGLVRAARFEPGPLERLIVLINPRHNARRGPTELYVKRGCPE